VEPKFLSRNGHVTLMSKAEHLLLWAVNSDSKGWYPLYEKRRERINSFENSSLISREVIARGLEAVGGNIKLKGYDKYYIVYNSRPERFRTLSIEADSPFEVFDYAGGGKLLSTVVNKGGTYQIEFETKLPGYGYKVIGLKKSAAWKEYPWQTGNVIESGDLKIQAENDKVYFSRKSERIELKLDTFQLKALAEMTKGIGDDVWRNAVKYEGSRISIRKALHPQLKIENQPDWLLHMEQLFTLLPDRVLCEVKFTFPHPTLIRKIGPTKVDTFDPQGLTLIFNSGKEGKVFYDIPFGISPHSMNGLSYFTPLSFGIFQYNSGNGFMLTTGSGEQAFYAHPSKGEVGMYLGASTSSGPIRDVGMEFVSPTNIFHEPAWYSEPFHGTYKHKFMLSFYNGDWKAAGMPAEAKSYTDDVYLKEIFPAATKGKLAPEKSLLQHDHPGIEITSMEVKDGVLHLRINDREGSAKDVNINLGGETRKVHIPANGIIDVTF
jgi:hypothetical protein